MFSNMDTPIDESTPKGATNDFFSENNDSMRLVRGRPGGNDENPCVLGGPDFEIAETAF